MYVSILYIYIYKYIEYTYIQNRNIYMYCTCIYIYYNLIAKIEWQLLNRIGCVRRKPVRVWKLEERRTHLMRLINCGRQLCGVKNWFCEPKYVCMYVVTHIQVTFFISLVFCFCLLSGYSSTQRAETWNFWKRCLKCFCLLLGIRSTGSKICK